jgi:peptidyl-prolyl cis-trans isomerase D
MLDFIRKRRRSWIVVFLFGAIVVVFVLWGVGSYVDGPRPDNVAQVNGETITLKEFEMHYQRMVEFYREALKASFSPEILKGLRLRSATLNDLVEKRLLLQEARRLGLGVSDVELMDAIGRIPEFQTQGRFDKNRYLAGIRASRLTPGQFEEQQRELLTVQKLYAIVAGAVQVTEEDLRSAFRLAHEKINLQFARLPIASFRSAVSVTEEEIKNYYKQNRQELATPLKIQVEYFSYAWDRFAAAAEITDKEIDEFYQKHRATRFRQAAAVKLSHLFVPVAAKADAKQKETARLRAEALLKEARGGQDFTALVKKHAENAVQGGEMGWATRGALSPLLEKVAFALKPGQISDVVESPAGFHVLKTDDVRPEKNLTLAEARGEILRSLREEKGRSDALAAAEADRERVRAGEDFSLVAKKRGQEVKISPWFGAFEVVPEIGPVQEFYRRSFALGEDEVGSPVEGPNRYYLIRLRGRREAGVPPLESAKAEIERRLKESRALELAQQKAQALLQQLKKERDFKKLAQENGLKIEETGFFARAETQIPRVGLLQDAREGGIPVSTHQPIADRVYQQRDAVYLFVFKESRPPSPADFEKERKTLAAQLLAQKRHRAVQKFQESLKAKALVKITTELIEEG